MTHFIKVYTNILNLYPVVAMHSLLVGFRIGTFLNSLYVDPLTNMDALLALTAIYISIEEHSEARKRVRA